jgi:Ca2+-binding RTX toxin-like protein
MNGGDGDDTLKGSYGNDTINSVDGTAGNDTVSCGSGEDTVRSDFQAGPTPTFDEVTPDSSVCEHIINNSV